MKWNEFWPEVEPRVRKVVECNLRGACGGVSCEDIVQDISVESWMAHENDKFHSPSYWVQRARWKTIDTLRKHRKDTTIECAPEQETRPAPHGVYDEVVSYLGEHLTVLLLEGMSITDCAVALGVSKATMSRRWNEARRRAVKMNLGIKSVGDNVYAAMLNGVRVADGRYAPSAQLLDVKYYQIVESNDTARKAIYEKMLDVAKASCGSMEGQPTPEDTQENVSDVSSLRQSGSTPANIVPDMANEREAPLLVRTDGLADRTPLGHAMEKHEDFPPTVREWAVACGGIGFCLGGSGQKVRGTFAQGWNARLKSALKKKGTENATKLAAEMGW